ncbi:mitochondrial carrier [Nemania abortiva]|nr:mitochondrial carrier [Nemania abortiva]
MAEFWAGYISGAASIIIGNPMDIIKVRLQAQSSSQPLLAEPTVSRRPVTGYPKIRSLVTGTLAPALGYGPLNGLLFSTYTWTEDALNRSLLTFSSPSAIISSLDVGSSTTGPSLWTTWLAGAVGGVAVWIVSAPTELIKCRAQLAPGPQAGHPSSPTASPPSSLTRRPSSSWHIFRSVLCNEGIRGLYQGGAITVLRDSIGYGFYFWAYQFGERNMISLFAQPTGLAPSSLDTDGVSGISTTRSFAQETIKTLLCGGVAGIVSWASIYPLDTVKTKVQEQDCPAATRKGAMQIAKEIYRRGGTRAFFPGLAVCSFRAFCVNAVQWWVYEHTMLQLGQSNRDRQKESNY